MLGEERRERGSVPDVNSLRKHFADDELLKEDAHQVLAIPTQILSFVYRFAAA